MILRNVYGGWCCICWYFCIDLCRYMTVKIQGETVSNQMIRSKLHTHSTQKHHCTSNKNARIKYFSFAKISTTLLKSKSFEQMSFWFGGVVFFVKTAPDKIVVELC